MNLSVEMSKTLCMCIMVALLHACQLVAGQQDIGNVSTWTLDLSQAPGLNSIIEASSFIAPAPGGGYQQSVDVGGAHAVAMTAQLSLSLDRDLCVRH